MTSSDAMATAVRIDGSSIPATGAHAAASMPYSEVNSGALLLSDSAGRGSGGASSFLTPQSDTWPLACIWLSTLTGTLTGPWDSRSFRSFRIWWNSAILFLLLQRHGADGPA